jgi:hypothetical protein
MIAFGNFSFAQDFAQKDSTSNDGCSVIIPYVVNYYAENGFHFISDCEIQNFKIDIFDKEGKCKYKTKKLRRDKTSYFVKLRRYKTGDYNWAAKYTILCNGQCIVKEAFGSVQFKN